MLEKLHIQNYRCFKDHIIKFKPLTTIVGKNNAGKTTIIETLRLLSIISSRYKGIRYSKAPSWLDLPQYERGIKPSLEGYDINFDTIFHRYGDPPAKITGFFDSGEEIEIYIGKGGDIYAVITDKAGKSISTKSEAIFLDLPSISILPQIGPLAINENILHSRDYIRKYMSSLLSSIHFRNQLNLFFDKFEEFKNISESSWQGLQIYSFEGQGGLHEDPLSLLIRDGDFVAEVADMGHGLQMWLQIMWFLTYAKDSETIILDEPDVYMHADLQRKLIRFLLGRHIQTIITTHSIEIMAEVSEDNILIVDNKKNESKYANSLKNVQILIDDIGGIHNIQLSRLWGSKKLLLVEGKDIRILKQFQDILYPESEEPLDIIPNMSIGGWSGWNYVIGSTRLLKNAVGEDITPFCILDSDSHTNEEIQTRYSKATDERIQLHIWKYKELENYLINPFVIHKYLCNKINQTEDIPTEEQINEKIITICEDLKDEICDALAEEIHKCNRGEGLKNANMKARERVSSLWQSEEGKLSLLLGKNCISLLSKWCQDECGLSLSKIGLARSFRIEDINSEIKMVIDSIENNTPFQL